MCSKTCPFWPPPVLYDLFSNLSFTTNWDVIFNDRKWQCLLYFGFAFTTWITVDYHNLASGLTQNTRSAIMFRYIQKEKGNHIKRESTRSLYRFFVQKRQVEITDWICFGLTGWKFYQISNRVLIRPVMLWSSWVQSHSDWKCNWNM